MKVADIAIYLKQVVMTSSGTCLFLGNDIKTFLIYVDSVMGEQIRFAFTEPTQSRPLTPDFLRYLLCGLEASIRNIVIYHADKGTFFSKVICQQSGGCLRTIEMDVRPSDAILLSIGMNKPMTITKDLWNSLSDTSDLLRNFSKLKEKNGKFDESK